MKARARRPVDKAKAATADAKAQVKQQRDHVVKRLKGGGRPR